MTAGTRLRARRHPGFSKKIFSSCLLGKSARPVPLTSAAAIHDRVTKLTAGGARPWTSSPDGLAAYDLYLAIGHLAAARAAAGLTGSGDATCRPTVTVAQIEDLLARPGDATWHHRELDSLYQDGLLVDVGPGEIAVCDDGSRPEVQYPGWDGGDPAGIPHLAPGEQRARILALHQRLAASGLPAGASFPGRVTAAFDAGRARGEVQLPAWAWAALVNSALLDGHHPISRRTAASRLAELREAGRLVMTRASRTVFDPEAWTFITIPAAYAAAKPGLAGVVQSCRARIRAPGGEERPAAPWRRQAARWRQRDLRSGWAA